MRMLVTGGAGFIGSHLADTLLQKGEQVVVVDDLSTGVRQQVPPGAVFHHGDLTGALDWDRLLGGVEIVFHLAAIASVPQSWNDPIRAHQVNTTATLELLRQAKTHGVRRVVLASSAAVYGSEGQVPCREDALPAPESPYAAAKLNCESLARVYARAGQVETVALRFFNVYGPRQNPASPYSGVLSRFISCFLSGQSPTIFGDGLQTRDFVFVADIVGALLLAAQAPVERVNGRAFNAGTGKSVTLKEVLELLEEIFGSALPPRFAPAQAGDVRHSRAETTAAQAALGFSASCALRDGLVSTVRWMRTHPASARSAPLGGR